MQPARSEPAPQALGHAEEQARAERAERDQRLAGWLAQAAEGDAQAFERFYDATIGYAQALARRLLREPDIDDVLAESYFQCWREAPRFDAGRGSAVTWLLTRVRSRAIDLRRAQAHEASEAAAGGESDELTLAGLASQLPGPDELLALAEAGSRLYHALAALSPQERWVLGLAYFRELSHAATAQVTGLPLGTVKSLLLRGQQKLRHLMSA
ncbi:RNA polymerase sigma factor [Aquabacterium sp.]|uniref:RNA polymerase sigma factor n=1 Tax=Aquabacterium sp. TaxID=1872578 RepID=UPI003784552E